MSDNTFTIGAIVSVEQLRAGFEEAGNITQGALEKFTADFESASVRSKDAMAKISADTEAAALTVGSEWKALAAATLQYRSALKEVAGATYIARAAGEDDAAAMALLAAAKQKAAEASTVLAAAQKAVAVSAEVETPAIEAETLSITELGTSIRGFASEFLGIGLGVGIFEHLINGAADFGVQMRNLSLTTGISASTLAGLHDAVEEMGGDFDRVSVGLSKMLKAQQDARDGMAGPTKGFQDLGISVKELGSLSPEQLLYRIAQGFNETGSTALKSQAAIDIFGRGGRELISVFEVLGPLFQQHIEDEAKASGLTDANAAADAKWKESVEELSVQLRALTQGVLPPLTQALPYLAAAFEILLAPIKSVIDAIDDLGLAVITTYQGIGTLMYDAVTGHFDRMISDAKEAGAEIVAMNKSVAQDIQDAWTKDISGPFNAASEPAPAAKRKTTEDDLPGASAAKGAYELAATHDKAALKIIEAREAAEKSASTSKVDEIRTEIAALSEKERIEKDLAKQEIEKSGHGSQPEKDAAILRSQQDITQEYYYKRIDLENRLSTAQTEANVKSVNILQAYTDLQNKENEMFAKSSEKDVEKSIETAQRKADSGIKYTEEYNKIVEKSLLRELAEQEAAVTANARLQQAELAGAMTTDFARLEISTQINARELAEQQELENKKHSVIMHGLEARKAALLGGQTEQEFNVANQPGPATLEPGDNEKLDRLMELNSKIEAAQKLHDASMLEELQESKKELLAGQSEPEFVAANQPKSAAVTAPGSDKARTDLVSLNAEVEAAKQAHVARMNQFTAMETLAAQEAADKQLRVYTRAFQGINQSFQTVTQQILEGTKTVQRAFVEMGANILMSTIQSLEQMVLKWVEHWLIVNVLEKSAAVQSIITFFSGAAAKHAAVDAAAVADTTTAAGVGAAFAFASVMESLPFPVNVATAPGVAAATFAEIEAVGLPKALKGALIPHDMPIFAHGDEMVLPPPLSRGFQHIIGNMSLPGAPGGAGGPGGPGGAGANGEPGESSSSSEVTNNFGFSAFDSRNYAKMIETVGLPAGLKSALVPHDLTSFAHSNDMVAPPALTKTFQQSMANVTQGPAGAAGAAGASGGPGGSGSGITHNYDGDINISAFDSKGIADMIRRNRGEFTRAAAGVFRDGWRPK